MNPKNPVLLTVLGLALVTGLAIAATTTPVAPPAPPAAAPEAFRAKVAETLGLSAEQQKAIDALRTKQRAEMQALKDGQDLAPGARWEKARAIAESYRGQMRALLTPEQQKKMDEWHGPMIDRAREARQHRPGPPAGRGDHGDRGARRGPGLQPAPAHNPLAIVALGERIKDRIAEQLQLTDEQRDKLEHLGRAYRAQQRDAAKKHLEEMKAVLTPEQQKKAGDMKKHLGRGPGEKLGPGGHRPPMAGINDLSEDMKVADLGVDPDDLPDEN